MEYLHQQPPQLRTGKNRRTGKESLCRQGSYGKISEWAYQSYQHLFTEVSPPIPPEYAEHFKVNGQLLPGYAIEGEERAQPTAEKAAPTTAEPPQDTEQRKERETINEQFSILIDSRSRFETGKPGGVWLPMPTTTEQLHAAMESVGITADNPQDFFINGYSSTEDCPFDLPLSVIQSASMDELNYFGKLLEMQSDGDKDKLRRRLHMASMPEA